MQVWRMEAENGLGPYRANGSYNLSPIEKAYGEDYNIFDAPHTPGPTKDKELQRNIRNLSKFDYEQWYFGFAVLDHYLSWIPEANIRTRLREIGVHLVRYEVPEEFFASGDTQAIFRKDKAERVEIRDCDFEPVEEQKKLALEQKVA